MVGLGLSVGAVLHASAYGQADTSRAKRDSSRARRDTTSITIPARPTADSTLRDTLAKRDSLHPRPVRRDTVKTPFAHAPMPVPISIGQSLVYDRAAIYASGSVTLQDFLDRIPEVTGLRAGWIAAPMFGAFTGDIRRVRVFLDGVEYDELDPRTDRILDLTDVPLWPLEEIRIERGATEIRVYTRTWRVDRTTPYTRTDVSTGDQQTNVYHGYFGRRWEKGEGLQVGAQQYGTTPPGRGSASSDQIAVMARVGWARGAWSLDAFGMRTNRNRGLILPQPIRGVPVSFDSIPQLISSRTEGYLRAAYGDPEHGPWVQAMAYSLGFAVDHKSPTSATTDTIPDSTYARTQYVVAAGYTAGPLRLDAAERLRVTSSKRLYTPSLRAEFVTGPLAVSAFAEGRGPDSLNRAEVTGRLRPLPFLSVLASAGRSNDRQIADSSLTTNFLRAEAAVRLFGLWVGGGVVRRDSVLLLPPVEYSATLAAVEAPQPKGSTALVPVRDAAATGITAHIEGTLYQALRTNLVGIRWNDSSGFYRPRYQARSEVYLATNWLSRFPSGNFGIRTAVWLEYRSRTSFPIVQSSNQSVLTVTSVPDSRSYNFQFEVRIVSATLTYQFRNIRGEVYQLVPGYIMPRLNQFYGVRWDFWN